MGQSIMQMDPVALADIKSEGYMAVAKTGQNGRVALSEIAKQSDVDSIQAEIGNLLVKTAAIAPDYDSTATYAVGDAVMCGGLRYVCSTAITQAEDWTPAHWTQKSVEDVIGDVETLLAAL